MTFQKLTYQLANGTVSGHIANKSINFTARPAQQGSQPPPGVYDIHPPIKDPIYGMVALMTPASASSSPGTAIGMKTTPRHLKVDFSAKLSPGAGAPGLLKTSPNAMKATGGTTNASVFVLSSRPIAGQNSLVVSTGFADLMDALQTAGGASVTVA